MNKHFLELSRWWVNLPKKTQLFFMLIFCIIVGFMSLHSYCHVVTMSSDLSYKFIVTLLYSLLMFMPLTKYATIAMKEFFELEKLNIELKNTSIRDSLTGLYLNRDFLKSEIKRMSAHAKRTNEKAVLLFADIDNFKDYNLQFSHAGGDYILRHIASIFMGTMRQENLLGRFGGDEFIMVLIVKDESEIEAFISRINKTLRDAHIYLSAQRVFVTVTFGVEVIGSAANIDEIFAAASKKMLAAKPQKNV